MKHLILVLCLLSGTVHAAVFGGSGGGGADGSVESFLASCVDNKIPKRVGGVAVCSDDSTGGTPSFDAVTNGTNTTATMTCSSPGCSVTGTGVHAADATTATTATTATNATNCTNATSATTAGALAANPTDCSVNQYATTIAANGNLTCAQPNFNQLAGTATDAQIPDDITVAHAAFADAAALAITASQVDNTGAGKGLTGDGFGHWSVDATVYTHTDCAKLYVRDGIGIVDTDDMPDTWHFAYDLHVTKLWCKTTGGTVSLNVAQQGGGGNVSSSTLNCSTTAQSACGQAGCTVALSATPVLADVGLDLQISSVSGSPVQLAVCLTTTPDILP